MHHTSSNLRNLILLGLISWSLNACGDDATDDYTGDVTGSIEFTARNSATDNEAGDTLITLVLSTSDALTREAQVDLVAQAGGTATLSVDFSIDAPSVVFPIGSIDGATQTVAVSIVEDGITEGNETILLGLDNASMTAIGDSDIHTLTIADDDIFAFAFATLSTTTTSEEARAINFDVSLTTETATRVALSVDVRDLRVGDANANNDYSFGSPKTITFPAGSMNGAIQSVSISVLADTVVEPNETIVFGLQNPTMGSVSSDNHTLTITDDDVALAFTAASQSTADEAAATVTVTVELLTTNATIPAITVDVVDLAAGTATEGAGNDYLFVSPQTLTFAAGSTNAATQSTSFDVLADVLAEPDETIIFALQNQSEGLVVAPSQHTATIVDDD